MPERFTMNGSPSAVWGFAVRINLERCPLAFHRSRMFSAFSSHFSPLTSHVLLPAAVALILAASVVHGGDSLFQPSVRSPRHGEVIYFLLPDRFNDGDGSNNRGEPGATNENGFDPANPNFFHGGDLQGITAKLDYLRDLGATSIWMTPIFRNLAVQNYEDGIP